MNGIIEDEFYKEIEESEFDKEIQGIYSKTDYEQFSKLFKIVCQKCGKEAEMITYDDIREGSEYTGTYGDSGIVVKCRHCGNAIRIFTADF